jgi:hypothetical protein
VKVRLTPHVLDQYNVELNLKNGKWTRVGYLSECSQNGVAFLIPAGLLKGIRLSQQDKDDINRLAAEALQKQIDGDDYANDWQDNDTDDYDTDGEEV